MTVVQTFSNCSEGLLYFRLGNRFALKFAMDLKDDTTLPVTRSFLPAKKDELSEYQAATTEWLGWLAALPPSPASVKLETWRNAANEENDGTITDPSAW